MLFAAIFIYCIASFALGSLNSTQWPINVKGPCIALYLVLCFIILIGDKD